MDFNECFKILTDRKAAQTNHIGEADAACPCCYDSALCGPVTGSSNEEKIPVISENELQGFTSIQLIDHLCQLQVQRVKTYFFFQTELERLLEQDLLKHYPVLCAQMTNKFNELSSSILQIKEEAKSRNQTALVEQIAIIQSNEKDKLTYIAADHLNRMHNQLPQLRDLSGSCEVQKSYLKTKISECEERISEALETIQSLKIDIMEAEEV